MVGTSIVTGTQAIIDIDQGEIKEIEAEVIDLETRLRELERELVSDDQQDSPRFLKTTARFALPTSNRNVTGKQKRQLTRSHFYRRLLQSRIESLEREKNSLKVLNNELEQQIAYATNAGSVQVARPPHAAQLTAPPDALQPYQVPLVGAWQEPEESGLDISYYLRMLAKSWWLILLTSVVATLIALFASYTITPIYQTTARYLVSPTSELSGTQAIYALETLKNRIIITTYAEVLNSRRIYEQIGESLEIDPALLAEYTISPVVVPEASVLEVTTEGPNPEVAVLLANQVGRQTVNYLTGAYDAYDVELLDEALLPEAPISPNPLQNAGIALVLGLVLGIGLALIRGFITSLSESERSLSNKSDSNVYSRQEFEQRLEEELKNDKSLSLGMVEVGGTTEGTPAAAQIRQVIERIVKILPNELRGKDVVGYWSSSRVVILMPSVPSMMAYSEFHYIQQVLAESLRTDSDATVNSLVPHIGVVNRRHNEPAETLIEQAQKALEEAQQSGKSVVLFSPHKALGSE